jgi:hypothetical protein
MKYCFRVVTVSTLSSYNYHSDTTAKVFTYLSFIRCTNGFDFPGLGGALAMASILSDIVAVKSEVCLSAGRDWKIVANSDANVGVNRRSASSRTL